MTIIILITSNINSVWYLLYGLLNSAILFDLTHHIGLDFIVIVIVIFFILRMKTEIILNKYYFKTFKLQVSTVEFIV